MQIKLSQNTSPAQPEVKPQLVTAPVSLPPQVAPISKPIGITLTPVQEKQENKPHTEGQLSAAHLTDSTTDEENITSITIVLPRNAYFMSGVRDFTLQMVMNMTGFSEQWAYRFQSVVDELCNNAIEHGSGPGSSVKCTFVSEKGKSIEIIVEDTQTGKNKQTAESMRQIVEKNKQIDPLKSGSIRGRGLAFMVYNWTDELTFEDLPSGGLRARAKKYLKPEENK